MRDYTELITSEHRDKPKFRAMVQAVSGAVAGAGDVLASLPQVFDIDTAGGEQLDIVGLWVGQSRVIPSVLLVQFFGFENNPAALTFGEENAPQIGGRFFNEGEPIDGSTVLADPEYRTILRGKIVRNHAKGKTDDLVRAISFMFSAPCVIEDTGQMSIGVFIGRPLTLVEQAIVTQLDILPRPAGVRIGRLGYYFGDSYLGFEGQPGAQPFSEETPDGYLDGSWSLDGSRVLGATIKTEKHFLMEEFLWQT